MVQPTLDCTSVDTASISLAALLRRPVEELLDAIRTCIIDWESLESPEQQLARQLRYPDPTHLPQPSRTKWFYAQVLEHGIVNALVISDLIPAQRHLAKSQGEWSGLVDEFMDRHFERPLGKLIGSLRAVTTVPSDLDARLREALESRNWLAHHFFRERAREFLTSGVVMA